MDKPPKSIFSKILKRELHKHPFVVPVVTLLVLVFSTMAAMVLLGARTVGPGDSRVVQLSVEGEKQILPTRAPTVGDFLNRVKVTLKESDVVEPALDTPIDADGFRINVYRAKPVVIIDGDKRTSSLSAATTPRSIAAQVGVHVYPEDEIEYATSAQVLEDQVIGTELIIKRATPVNLNLYGTPVAVRTHVATIGELLAEKNITMSNSDTLNPGPDTSLTANMQIFLTRQGVKIVTLAEEIASPIEFIEDASLSFGSTAVRQAGSPGRKLVTYQLQLENNQEVARVKIQEVLVEQPVARIIVRGPQGSFAQALALLRKCEAGGNYQINTGNGYYGAYQFNLSTWQSNAPPPYNSQRPDQAPPEVQDIAATTLYRNRGWQPWPGCTSKLNLQDIYR